MPASGFVCNCVEQTCWHEHIESLRVNKTHAKVCGYVTKAEQKNKNKAKRAPKML